MRSLAIVTLPLLCAACLDGPEAPDAEPQARVIVLWDPLECGEPHRVAVELEDEAGVVASSSAWCAKGSISVDVRHFGIYRGRVYAWAAGEIRAEMPMRVPVDEPVLRWLVPTPR